MLKIIRNLLKQLIDDIDTNNTNIDQEQQFQIIRLLSNINVDKQEKNEFNKTDAADYIGVCRAQFDNYVRDGFIPKGQKVGNFKELRWYKCDLDLFLLNKNSKV